MMMMMMMTDRLIMYTSLRYNGYAAKTP